MEKNRGLFSPKIYKQLPLGRKFNYSYFQLANKTLAAAVNENVFCATVWAINFFLTNASSRGRY